MKLITGLLVVVLALGVYCQEEEETLLSVQDELGHAHRFFETLMGINRGQLSSYIYRASKRVMDSHLDTYEFILTEGLKARDHINSLEPGTDAERACVERYLNRFDLQKQRIGQRLARCVGNVQNTFVQWNNFINGIHRNAQLAAALKQNIGFNIFAGTEIFDGQEDLPAMMKADLRDFIFSSLELIDSVEDFIRDISGRIEEIEAEFTVCDKELEVAAVQELEFEVNAANACVGQGGGVDPDPTKL